MRKLNGSQPGDLLLLRYCGDRLARNRHDPHTDGRGLSEEQEDKNAAVRNVLFQDCGRPGFYYRSLFVKPLLFNSSR